MGIVETLKDVVSVVQKADNIEIMKGMLEVQAQTYALLEENHQLKTENRQLRDKLETQEALTFHDSAYWKPGGVGPFCSACWDTRRNLVYLHRSSSGYPSCPSCNKVAVNGQHDGAPRRPPERVIPV